MKLYIRSNFQKLMGIENHDGMYVDMPIHPYYNTKNQAVFTVDDSKKAARFLIDNKKWKDHTKWTLERNVYDSPLNWVYQDYDYKNWIGSTFRPNNDDNDPRVYTVMHHEWPIDGPAPREKHDVKTLIWGRSNDGGRTFFTKPYTSFADGGGSNNQRCWIIPSPSHRKCSGIIYGFFHPSNVVREGSYFYWSAGYFGFEDTPSDSCPSDATVWEGRILMRCRAADLNDPTKSEIFSRNRNWVKCHNVWKPYWGNDWYKPYVFWGQYRNPFEQGQGTSNRGTSIRWNLDKNVWVMFGVDDSNMGFATSSTLSDPQFDRGNSWKNAENDAGNQQYLINKLAAYTSMFDIDTDEVNFTNIGSKANCVAVDSRKKIYMCDIEFV